MPARKSSKGAENETPDPATSDGIEAADVGLDGDDVLEDAFDDTEDIEDADLEAPDLDVVALEEAELDEAELDEPDLDGPDLDEPDLDETDLDETDLDETDLDGADDDEPDDAALVPPLPPEAEFDDSEEELVAAVAGEDDLDDAEVDGLRDGEFVCRSCFLAKRETQLADPERLLCRDCA